MTDTANPSGADNLRPTDRTKSGATRSRDHEGDEKHLNIFQRMILFLQEVVGELKKVRYPTMEELRQYWVVVVVFVAVLMAFTGVVDYLFAKISTLVFV